MAKFINGFVLSKYFDPNVIRAATQTTEKAKESFLGNKSEYFAARRPRETLKKPCPEACLVYPAECCTISGTAEVIF